MKLSVKKLLLLAFLIMSYAQLSSQELLSTKLRYDSWGDPYIIAEISRSDKTIVNIEFTIKYNDGSGLIFGKNEYRTVRVRQTISPSNFYNPTRSASINFEIPNVEYYTPERVWIKKVIFSDGTFKNY